MTEFERNLVKLASLPVRQVLQVLQKGVALRERRVRLDLRVEHRRQREGARRRLAEEDQ